MRVPDRGQIKPVFGPRVPDVNSFTRGDDLE